MGQTLGTADDSENVHSDKSHVQSSILAYAIGMHRVSAPADELSDSLRSISVRSVVVCRSEFTAPWGFRVEDTSIAKFHLVLRGQAHLALDGEDEMHHLRGGDVVILPHGTGHALMDAPGSPTPSLDGILTAHPVDESGSTSYGGGGAVTT